MAQITETGTIDLKAQKAGHDDAAKTATNYIKADETGIRIASSDPDNATTYQHQTATSTEFMVEGESRMLISGDGQRIGKEYVQGATDNESHMELDYHSLKMLDMNGREYLYVSDLRDADGKVDITDVFMGDGTTTEFELSIAASNTSYDVTVDDAPASNVTKASGKVTFATAPADGARIGVTYTTKSYYAKAYTFGLRRSYMNIGACSLAEGALTTASGGFSHAEGYNTTAGGKYSHAEGYTAGAIGVASHVEGRSTTANGPYSHAEGYRTRANGDSSHAQNYRTIAASDGQTAMGKYNVEDTNGDYALIIGNGTANDARSNALAVDWDGGVYAHGHVSPIGTIKEAYADIAASSVSTNTDAPTKGAAVTLEPGIWLVVGRFYCPGASDGSNARNISCHLWSADSYDCQTRIATAWSYWTAIDCTQIYNVSSNLEVSVRVSAGLKPTSTAQTHIRCVRIA